MSIRFVICSLLLLCSLALNAEDVIVMRNGDLVNAKITEITQTEIKYKKVTRLDGPTYTINKSDVLAINYEDGEKETFEERSSSQEEAIVATLPQPAIDQDSIDILNNQYFTVFNVDCFTFNDKPKNKITKKGFGLYHISENSKFTDGYVYIAPS